MCLTLRRCDCLGNLCSRFRERKTAPSELIGTLSKIQNHTDWHQITRVVFYFFFWHGFRLDFGFVHEANILYYYHLVGLKPLYGGPVGIWLFRDRTYSC